MVPSAVYNARLPCAKQRAPVPIRWNGGDGERSLRRAGEFCSVSGEKTAALPTVGARVTSDAACHVSRPMPHAHVSRWHHALRVNRIVCVDLHGDQLRGCSNPSVPIDNVPPSSIAMHYFKANFDDPQPVPRRPLVFVAPDANGVLRTKHFMEGMAVLGCTGLSFAMLPASFRYRTAQR